MSEEGNYAGGWIGQTLLVGGVVFLVGDPIISWLKDEPKKELTVHQKKIKTVVNIASLGAIIAGVWFLKESGR